VTAAKLLAEIGPVGYKTPYEVKETREDLQNIAA